MKRHMGIWTAAPLLAVLVSAGPARADDPGLTVLTFLKLGAGAQAASMGDAYVSVADDASATYWNPAGLLGIRHNDLLAVHNAWIQDFRHEFASYGKHLGRHAVGVSFIGFYTADIEARDETGAYAGHFGYSDNAFGLSYAFQVTPTLGVGTTARYLRESLVGTTDGDLSLNGWAFDFGARWQTPFTGVTAGAAVRNLGSQLSYNFAGAQSFDLPTALQAGVSYVRPDLGGGAIRVAADFLGARGDNGSVRFGAEYTYRGQFLLGAGYKTGMDSEDMSFGVGYENRIKVHYAFVPIQNNLGSSHRISLGYGW